MNDKYYYLIQALKNYRHKTYGLFDQPNEHIVKETQDAAVAIEELCSEVCRLKREIEELHYE